MSNETTTSAVPTPHIGQEQVINLPGRYRVAVCGRRFGKTVAAAIAAVRRCEEAKADKPQRVWWVSPVQEQSERVERQIALWLNNRLKTSRKGKNPSPQSPPPQGEGRPCSPSLSGKGPGVRFEENKPAWTWEHRKLEHALVHIESKSRIEFHSAHCPDLLRGAGLELLVVDEAADVSEYAWKMVLKPMLLDSRGEAFIIGTPRGTQHWLHRVFLLGQDERPGNPYASIALPTRANPRIAAAEIEEFRSEMSGEEFRQEFEAEFIDGVNAVFTKVSEAVSGEPLVAGRRGDVYVTGIDLGRARDFTALVSVHGGSERAEGFARFNQYDWSEQLRLMLEHLRRFPGPCVIDATSLGDPVYEQLRDLHRFHVEAFVFTALRREEMLSGLRQGFSTGAVKLANIPELIRELHAFTHLVDGEAGAARRVKTGAPPGQHDDCVMALGRAWWGLKKLGLWGRGTGENPWRGGVFG